MISPSQVDLLILESHPVQYHAPVYRELTRLCSGRVLVAYATDCSVRGHHDPGFGQSVAWNVPLLEGYDFVLLHAERGEPLRGARSLHGWGIPRLLRNRRPHAVLFNQLVYEFEWVAYAMCLALGIRMWLRTETQDEAFERGWIKSLPRSLVYRLLYAPMSRFFYIGELNRRHYLAHGVPEAKLTPARYCVPDVLAMASPTEKQVRRTTLRSRLGLADSTSVVAFFGKLIPKKNPGILIDAWSALPSPLRLRTNLLFVGDGELRAELAQKASAAGCPTIFTGFINQLELADYYLAADIVVLASWRMGETWGLVVNEALQAGCGVVISEAVGCGVEFANLPRVSRVPVGSPSLVAEAIARLAEFPRDFECARAALAPYSVTSAAKGLAQAIIAGP
jgi:glycosyltransferase involved in cell wall biosynthesis